MYEVFGAEMENQFKCLQYMVGKSIWIDRLQEAQIWQVEKVFQTATPGSRRVGKGVAGSSISESFREAANIVNLHRSYYYRTMKRRTLKICTLRRMSGTFLTTEEERNIVTALEKLWNERNCVRTCEVADDVERMVSTHPEDRQKYVCG